MAVFIAMGANSWGKGPSRKEAIINCNKQQCGKAKRVARLPKGTIDSSVVVDCMGGVQWEYTYDTPREQMDADWDNGLEWEDL